MNETSDKFNLNDRHTQVRDLILIYFQSEEVPLV